MRLIGKKHHIFILCLLGISFIFVVSRSLLPMFFGPTQDSAVFLTIGKCWAQGRLPYVEAWDLKGPIIFFINALGYFITGSGVGVLLIEFICICLSLLLVYKLFQYEVTVNKAFVFTLITFVVLLSVFAANSVEEYTLPLLIASFIGFWRWGNHIEKGSFEHDVKFAFLYGACVCFCLYTRATDAIGICGGVAVITITLCCKKEWKNLLYNALSFLGGFLVLFLPFLIYFAANHALYDMWFGTILYELGYVATAAETAAPFKQIILRIVVYFSCISLPFTGVLTMIFNKERRITGLMWIIIGGLTGLWLFNSFGFRHYGTVALPYFCISIMELHKLSALNKKVFSDKLSLKTVSKFSTVCFIIVGLIGGGYGVHRILQDITYEFVTLPTHQDEEPLIIEERFVLDVVPKDELDSFIAWNCDNGLYLKLDANPYYPMFGLQEFVGDCNETMQERIYETFLNGDAKWILVRNDAPQIQDILENRYTCESVLDVPELDYQYTLWRLK